MASDISYCKLKTTFSNSPISPSFECKWVISGLSPNQLNTEVESPEYFIAPGIEACFDMTININGLFFNAKFKTDPEIECLPFNAHFQTSLLDVNGREIHDEFQSVVIRSRKSILNKSIVLSIGKHNYKWEKIFNQKGNDFVFYTKVAISRLEIKTIVADMKICNFHQNAADMKTSNLHPNVALQNFSQHILDMYLKSVNTDLVLKIRGKNLLVHKAVLRSRSGVFNQMFEHSLAEDTNNVINIKDISVEIMKELLRFIYSGTMIDYDYKTAYHLYEAADKYDVSDLRKICCDSLLKHLSIENVLEVMLLADRRNDEYLKNRAMKYVSKNMKNIFSFESWKEFALAEPILAGEIVMGLS